MRRKIRWELLFFDSIIFLSSAALILLIYPSSLFRLTTLQIAAYAAFGWLCVTVARFFFRTYLKIWRYAGYLDYIRLMMADGIAAIVFTFTRAFIPNTITFMRGLSLFTLNLLGCIVIRMIYQHIYQNRSKQGWFEKTGLWLLKTLAGVIFPDEKMNSNRIKIAIIGAGSVGAMLADELEQNPRAMYKPVCFVDVDRGKVGREIQGIPVLPSDGQLKGLLESRGVQEVVFALPNVPDSRREELYKIYSDYGYKIKAYDYPTFGGRATLHDIRIEDLLSRNVVEFLTDEVRDYYRGKSVLITGGGGSIGSELARQISKCKPSRLVLLDVYENGAYEIQQELLRKDPTLNLRVEIVSICDREMLERIFSLHTPDIVLHAAAHKHVPLMERNVVEAVKNNVFGTLNVVETCEKYGVSRFIMISTDKAVNPTNVMGATKRMCEMIVLSRPKGKTKFSATRFGNVLGSNGSVIPLFEKQIVDGGPVTITDKRIIRYFMTIPEASQLVMTSGAMAENGELYILDMGRPVRILDLAENMIRMAGLEPGKDIEIVETGLRDGEKLYEELLVKGEKLGKTSNEKIFTEKDTPITMSQVKEKLEILKKALESRSNRIVRDALKSVIPTYHSPEEINSMAEASEEMREAN